MSHASSPPLPLLVAQLNPILGDLAGNRAQHLAALAAARASGAQLVVCPEMSLTGYPPDDLALNPDFLAACATEVATLAAATVGGPALLLGAPQTIAGSSPRNAAWLLDNGQVHAVIGKRHLPSYGEFYDPRIFSASQPQGPVSWRGYRLGIMICEDAWFPEVAGGLAQAGAEVLLTLNASPFAVGKAAHRQQEILRARTAETNLPLLYVNMVGGHDELVFDGGSVALDADGQRSWQAPFAESSHVRVTLQDGCWHGESAPYPPDTMAALYGALQLAVRDYWRKNNFSVGLVGLSGGIDSGLVAALLADALGPSQVRAVRLPSPHTSTLSSELAAALAGKLGIPLLDLPISAGLDTLSQTLTTAGIALSDFTADNLQSRLRGLLLMALTNANAGWLLASTGNKSEIALGYCTLYGDTNGGFNPLKDVYKTDVYALARWRNQHVPAGSLASKDSLGIIPDAMLTRPATAETRSNQTDEGSLGYPYSLIDQILRLHIDNDAPYADMVAATGNEAAVRAMLARVRGAQYKRQQACPGPKVSARAFGRSRQYPIINGFDPSHYAVGDLAHSR